MYCETLLPNLTVVGKLEMYMGTPTGSRLKEIKLGNLYVLARTSLHGHRKRGNSAPLFVIMDNDYEY